jgi:DNA end-binding protein Ku
MRAIASLSLSFGLVAIPVKLYSATEASAAIRFKLMGRSGVRLRQQYVADTEPDAIPAPRIEPEPAPVRPTAGPTSAVREPVVMSHPAMADDDDIAEPAAIVERDDIVKGYEYEKGRFVLFTADELKALKAGARDTIDIVSFIPAHAVDPLYYDKPYLLAPGKGGEKTYSLLLAALRESGRSALAKWAWKARQHVVEVRAVEGGLVLQQLLYADEVRTLQALDIPLVDVSAAELKLALQLIAQSAEDAYDPNAFVDEEKLRLMAAIERKIAGQGIRVPDHAASGSGQVIDLMAALRASLREPEAAATGGREKPARRPAVKTASAPRKAARTAGQRPAAPAKTRRQAAR